MQGVSLTLWLVSFSKRQPDPKYYFISYVVYLTVYLFLVSKPTKSGEKESAPPNLKFYNFSIEESLWTRKSINTYIS